MEALAIQEASAWLFRGLTQRGVPATSFFDVLSYKPAWLHGLSVHDALAFHRGAREVGKFAEELSERFSCVPAKSAKDRTQISAEASVSHPKDLPEAGKSEERTISDAAIEDMIDDFAANL